jgi:ribosomal protein S18 acetylase RimI-like enzyme
MNVQARHTWEYLLHAETVIPAVRHRRLFVDNPQSPLLIMMMTVQHDSTAVIWPPYVFGSLQNIEAQTVQHMIEAAAEHAKQAGGWVLQSLIEAEDPVPSDILTMGGMEYLTDLNYLRKTLLDYKFDAIEEIPSAQIIKYHPGTNDTLFIDVIEQSFIDSQDCPEVSHGRTAKAAFQSYRYAGHFSPDNWFVMVDETGVAQGVVLLTEHTEIEQWELIYLGVAVNSRKRGIGKKLMHQALRHVKDRRGQSLILAVDFRNSSALQLYRQAGFELFQRQKLHLQLLTNSSK